jgi:starch synthase (maltosyl-transferring)
VPANESPTGREDTVVVVASFDPHAVNEAIVTLDMSAIGKQDDDPIPVLDAVTGAKYTWGREFFVRLDPSQTLVHVATVRS